MRAVVKDATIRVQEAESKERGKPGPKVGGFNPDAFQPGHDPRRHLRGPLDGAKQKTIEHIASQHAQEAVDALLDVLSDQTVNAMARVTAANTLLDRAFGKAVDRQVSLSLNDQGSKGPAMTRDELLAHLSSKAMQELTQADIVAEQPQSNQSLTDSGSIPILGTDTQDTPHPFSETNDDNVD